MKKAKILAAICIALMLVWSGCGYNLDDFLPVRGRDREAGERQSGTDSTRPDSTKPGSTKPDSTNAPKTPVPMGEAGTWTIFVYLCGSDLESNQGFATNDLLEMVEASKKSNVRFLVQTGGAYQWQNEVMDPEKIERYEIREGDIFRAKTQNSASMGSADILADFLKWGVEGYPAARMGIVFWNHGGGSINGVCFDEKYGQDSLSLMEIDYALQETSPAMSDQFEFVGFDACLMATAETANMLSPYARYMYASEENEPGYGWDYTAIGECLGANPYADGQELGKVICDSFYESCDRIGEARDATLSVVDLSKMDDVITSFNVFAENLYQITETNAVLSAFVRNVGSADNFGGNNKAEGYTNMVDLAGIIYSASDVDGAYAALSAIQEAVIYQRTGSNHPNACGLAIYYPLQLQGSEELKIFGQLAISPYYLSLVDRLVYGNTYNGRIDTYDNSAIMDFWTEGETDSAAYDNYWNSYGNCEPTGNSALIEFYDDPQLLEDGTFAFSLTDESLEYTASVQANVYMISDDGEDLIEFGTSVDIIPDWETGVFMDNFDGYWFSLPDGQNLAVYVVDEYDGFDIYTAPVILNGQETNIRIIHNYWAGQVIVDCAWDGIDENGMASKNYYELRPGDSITPIYNAYAIEGDDEYYYYGNEYIFDGEPEIYFDQIYDGEYLYAFTIYDIFGDYILTQFVNFTVDGGNLYFQELYY